MNRWWNIKEEPRFMQRKYLKVLLWWVKLELQKICNIKWQGAEELQKVVERRHSYWNLNTGLCFRCFNMCTLPQLKGLLSINQGKLKTYKIEFIVKQVGTLLHITPTVFIRWGTNKKEGHEGLIWGEKATHNRTAVQ